MLAPLLVALVREALAGVDLNAFVFVMMGVSYAKNTLTTVSLIDLGLGNDPLHATYICNHLLRDNFVLQALILGGNKFSDKDTAMITKTAGSTKRLEYLVFDRNYQEHVDLVAKETGPMCLIINSGEPLQIARGLLMAAQQYPSEDDEKCDDWALDTLVDYEFMKYWPFFKRLGPGVSSRLRLVAMYWHCRNALAG